ncbi:extracellular solute-binding protein [Aliisedimentitalea scapharcae]|uniref:Extracellular solute-binding protein n=1 Tax=Aliisedimentitalea scapharcae TaxID=1524259 RepID=A0ABZ2XPZ1_9RHOB
MRHDYFQNTRRILSGIALLCGATFASAESTHGIAMYGDPALPPDFVSLPYANPQAPKGGRVIFGNTGGFDSLNPFVQKGTAPWQMRFWSYESLMGRSWDEPFTLYGLLAESVETSEDRSWVEFTLRPEARFADGSPVTIEDVLWSYEVLGTKGHLRYRTLWSQMASIEQTGPRTVRITFKDDNRELALIAGLRPILKKDQYDGRDFTDAPLEAPVGSGPYVIGDVDPGRFIEFRRNPDYWGKDLPLRRGTANFDEMRVEFYGDQAVMFEAFKAGELTAIREFNADTWARQYDFPSVVRGDVVKTEIPHERPTGMTGIVMNARRVPFDDWRVREALLLAFNFEYINGTLTGGTQPRITSYYANSYLGLRPGPATGKVRDLLAPFADSLLPGTIDGYTLPQGDDSARNRRDLRAAARLLSEAGWRVEDGLLRDDTGRPMQMSLLLRQGDTEMKSVAELYARALERLGITLVTETVDNAQYVARQNTYDFDLTRFRRDLSLSPGNEQKLYWGKDGVTQPGTRNLMGVDNPAIEAMLDTMLTTTEPDTFTAAVRALDRVLTAGRYVIPIWQFDKGRIAHAKQLKYPDTLPLYGDRIGFMPEVWWFEE